MGKPHEPRKKAPKADLTHPARARKGKDNYFSKLMPTEEGRALRKQWSTKKRVNAGRPSGTPDGYTKDTIAPIRTKAKLDAERIVKIMAEDNNIDDIYAIEALKTAVQIMREPSQSRDRLTAARMVLDFTKTKPAAKSEVTIGKAEAFLESLLVADPEEEQNDEDGPET